MDTSDWEADNKEARVATRSYKLIQVHVVGGRTTEVSTTDAFRRLMPFSTVVTTSELTKVGAELQVFED
jgi:hypothetical protein